MECSYRTRLLMIQNTFIAQCYTDLFYVFWYFAFFVTAPGDDFAEWQSPTAHNTSHYVYSIVCLSVKHFPSQPNLDFFSVETILLPLK